MPTIQQLVRKGRVAMVTRVSRQRWTAVHSEEEYAHACIPLPLKKPNSAMRKVARVRLTQW